MTTPQKTRTTVYLTEQDRERLVKLKERYGLGVSAAVRAGLALLERQMEHAALMDAAGREREMNEYFECVNCGQVVQGWNASQMIECCEFPQHTRVDGPERDVEFHAPIPRPTDDDAELFATD